MEAAAAPHIGTLNEGALHAQLKEWLREPDDLVETAVGGHVIDVARPGPEGPLLIEIQTGGFSPLRRKLAALTAEHRVRIVFPVALTRRVVKVDDVGEVLSARRSPQRGRVEDVFARLVSLPGALADPRIEIEVVLTHQDEVRVHREGKAWRRHGWVVLGRSLASVEGSVRIDSVADAVALLPPLDEPFATAELARAAGIDRRLAQQAVYCLREAGGLELAGKRGNALLYRRVRAPTGRRGGRAPR